MEDGESPSLCRNCKYRFDDTSQETCFITYVDLTFSREGGAMKTQPVLWTVVGRIALAFLQGCFIYLKGSPMKSFLRVILLSVAMLISACATAPAQVPTATMAPVATVVALPLHFCKGVLFT